MAEVDIPHIEVDVLPETLEEDFRQILDKIKPTWKNEDVLFEKSAFEVSRGLLNTMVKCYDKNDPMDAIMIRVHNVKFNEFITRSVEVLCIKYFMKMDCAPKILATFKTGFCYEFIHGEILGSDRLSEEPIWRLIAEEIAKFHSGDIEDEDKLVRYPQMRNMVNEVWAKYPTDLPDPEKDEKFKRELPAKAVLMAEVEQLLEHCDKLGSPLVLCHNDTRGENIIWNADLEILKFVDFEGMNYNYQAAELAAHFSRFCGLTPPDYSLIPSEEFQSKWLRHYLERYNHYAGKKDAEITDKDVRTLYVQVKKFHLFYLIMIGLFGPVMEAMNVLNSDTLNILEFSLVSVKEYYKMKDEILNLSLP